MFSFQQLNTKVINKKIDHFTPSKALSTTSLYGKISCKSLYAITKELVIVNFNSVMHISCYTKTILLRGILFKFPDGRIKESGNVATLTSEG